MKTSMNSKDIITSFILPVNPTGQYKRFVRICNTEKINCKNLSFPATFLKEHENSSITISKNVLRMYVY